MTYIIVTTVYKNTQTSILSQMAIGLHSMKRNVMLDDIELSAVLKINPIKVMIYVVQSC